MIKLAMQEVWIGPIAVIMCVCFIGVDLISEYRTNGGWENKTAASCISYISDQLANCSEVIKLAMQWWHIWLKWQKCVGSLVMKAVMSPWPWCSTGCCLQCWIIFNIIIINTSQYYLTSAIQYRYLQLLCSWGQLTESQCVVLQCFNTG